MLAARGPVKREGQKVALGLIARPSDIYIVAVVHKLREDVEERDVFASA